MSDTRYIVTTCRLPREVHEKMKAYVKDFNYGVGWWEKKMSYTVLIGMALTEYIKGHPVEVVHKIKSEREAIKK